MPPKDRSKRQQVVERGPDEVTREYKEDSESSEGTIVAPGPGEPAFTPNRFCRLISKHLLRLITNKQKLTGK